MEKVSLELSVRESAKAAKLLPADQAALELALKYARHLDFSNDARKLADLGPKLVSVLKELGMTPLGRAVPKISKEVASNESSRSASALARLRGDGSA